MSRTPAPTIGALETIYQGICFRSRLEARWTVLFDEMGWVWEHEPEGYSDGKVRYLPDFWLPGLSMFWEVKRDPTQLSETEMDAALNKAMMLVEVTSQTCAIAFGLPQSLNYDDPGRLLLVFPDGSDEIRDWSTYDWRFHEAAATARAYHFWDPK